MMTKKIRVFLINGFRYEGTEIELTKYYLRILDFKENKEFKIPTTSIASIETLSDGDNK